MKLLTITELTTSVLLNPPLLFLGGKVGSDYTRQTGLSATIRNGSVHCAIVQIDDQTTDITL